MNKTLLGVVLACCALGGCKKERKKTEVENPLGWQYHRFVDKMSDAPSYKAITKDLKGNWVQIGCDGVGKNSIYASVIFPRHYLGGDDKRFLEWRADKGQELVLLADYDKNSASLLDHAEACASSRASMEGRR